MKQNNKNCGSKNCSDRQNCGAQKNSENKKKTNGNQED